MANKQKTEEQKPLLVLNKVSKRFALDQGRELEVLDDINVSVNAGEIIAFLGPSGCGKTTMLKIMAGLIEPTEGGVLIGDKVLQGINDHLSLVFQSPALLPWFTVEQNIAIGLRGLGLTSIKIKKRVDESVDMCSLGGFEDVFPPELSGGLKQRVALARALAVRPEILCLDEPFNSLDALTAEDLRAEVIDLWREKSSTMKTIILVTHNIQEAVFMAQRIFVYGANPGHIRTVVNNPLPYPRDVKSKKFQELVEVIHAVITEALMPEEMEEKKEEEASWYQGFEYLPKVVPSEITGLLEVLDNAGGRMDIFKLANETGSEFGHCLAVVKTAELLDLVDTPKQVVAFTELGTRFVDVEIAESKAILSKQISELRIFKAIVSWLEEVDGKEIERDEVIDRLQTYFPNENLDRLFDTIVAFGRYAEILAYNAQLETLSFPEEEPEEDLEEESEEENEEERGNERE